ncbi:hypothetical protein M758_2G206400 [Ceratodon purpureus]|nr:hypothetical protein M758_2G205900 [Ceratodon purpureus]KAG0627506.1 hypothetical protein M758_2G206400 [Ceratodon purpureus]
MASRTHLGTAHARSDRTASGTRQSGTTPKYSLDWALPWDAATSTRQCRSITHCILCSPLKRQSSSVSQLSCRNRVRLNDYLRSSISNLQPTLTAEAQRVRLTAHSVSSATCYDTRL